METNTTDKKWFELSPINGDLAEALAEGSKIEIVKFDREQLPHILVRFNKERLDEGRHPHFGYFELTGKIGSRFYIASNYFCSLTSAKSYFLKSYTETRISQLRIAELKAPITPH